VESGKWKVESGKWKVERKEATLNDRTAISGTSHIETPDYTQQAAPRADIESVEMCFSTSFNFVEKSI